MKGRMTINGVVIADKDGEDLLTKIENINQNQILLNELLFREYQRRNAPLRDKVRRFFMQKV